MRRLVPFLAVLCCVLGLESSGATVSSVLKPLNESAREAQVTAVQEAPPRPERVRPPTHAAPLRETGPDFITWLWLGAVGLMLCWLAWRVRPRTGPYPGLHTTGSWAHPRHSDHLDGLHHGAQHSHASDHSGVATAVAVGATAVAVASVVESSSSSSWDSSSSLSSSDSSSSWDSSSSSSSSSDFGGGSSSGSGSSGEW